MPLRWGEITPLWFIERAYQEEPSGGSSSSSSSSPGTSAAAAASDWRDKLPPVILVSLPAKRYGHASDRSMVRELLQLGGSLHELLDDDDERRVAVVISGDLAHTHLADGPYGYSRHAAPFDAAMVEWAENMDREALLVEARMHEAKAMSCGFPGFVMLQGMLDRIQPDDVHSVVLEAGHPDYYGMMVAVWDFEWDQPPPLERGQLRQQLRGRQRQQHGQSRLRMQQQLEQAGSRRALRAAARQAAGEELLAARQGS